jgi:hypothetical protein
MRSFGGNWIGIWVFENLGERSKKGSTRKHTGNRVTRRTFLLLGEYWLSRCFTKRNGMGFAGLS